MRELKKIAVIVVTFILLLNNIFLVSAEDQKVATKPPTFLDSLIRSFRSLSFTIVGQDNHADVYPRESFDVQPSTSFKKTKSQTYSLCNQKSGLYNVYVKKKNDNKWYEQFEMIDDIEFYCTSSNTVEKCIVELYCMPYKYPPSDSDCNSNVGEGSKSRIKNTVDSLMPLKDVNNNNLGSYTYCTETCSGDEIKCWGINGNQCQSREYSCGYETYPDCPTSWPYKGTTASNSGCQSDLPSVRRRRASTISSTSRDTPPSDDQTPTPLGSCGDGKCSGGENWETCSTDCSVIITDIEFPNPKKSYGMDFKISLENKKGTESYVNLEAGFYTKNYAKDEAGLPENTFLYSVFGSNVEPHPNCEASESFVNTVRVKLNAYEKKTVKIDAPRELAAYVALPKREYVTARVPYISSKNPLVAFAGMYESCCEFKVGGGCEAGTGGYQYWKTDWNYYPLLNYITDQEIVCAGEVYGKFDVRLFGDPKIIIEKNYKDCLSKYFIIKNISDKEKEEELNDSLQGKSFRDFPKISLTKEEIGKVTTNDLLASACIGNSECLSRDNYTVSCVRANKLKEEGLIGDAEIEDIKDKAAITFIGAGGGAGLALVGCALAAAATVASGGIASPWAITFCGVGGAVLGGTFGYAATEISEDFGDIFNKDDELTKAIKSGNSAEYGICTAEDKSFFNLKFLDDLAKSFPITGNPTYDKLIIIFGLFVIITILLNILLGKK